MHSSASYFRCVVGHDGTFAFHSTKGKHHIFFMDAATSTLLYHAPKLVEVGAETNCAFEIPLTRVRVRLLPEREGGDVVVGKLEWLTHHKGDSANHNFGRYDQGYGVYPEGRTDFFLYLPPVRTEFGKRIGALVDIGRGDATGLLSGGVRNRISFSRLQSQLVFLPSGRWGCA